MEKAFEEIGARIGLDAAQIRAALHAYERDPKGASALVERVRTGGNPGAYLRAIHRDPETGGAWALAGALLMAQCAGEDYRARGIPQEIFMQTMSDIKIWADTYRRRTGCDGLGEIAWIVHHCRLELFRLGRLQFERGRVPAAPFVPLRRRRTLPLRRGSPCLAVHIPEGEPLDPAACRASLEDAPAFFARYYPAEHYEWFCCFSWLLYSGNRMLLPPESNIVRFMDLWEICFDWKNDAQAVERIWGRRERDVSRYETDTLLRANARRWMEQGNRLGMGLGFRMMPRDERAEK